MTDRPAPAKPSVVGVRLLLVRTNSSLTQRQLAARSGVSASTISKVENGFLPGFDLVDRLAQGLRCSPAFLRGETNDPQMVESLTFPLHDPVTGGTVAGSDVSVVVSQPPPGAPRALGPLPESVYGSGVSALIEESFAPPTHTLRDAIAVARVIDAAGGIDSRELVGAMLNVAAKLRESGLEDLEDFLATWLLRHSNLDGVRRSILLARFDRPPRRGD